MAVALLAGTSASSASTRSTTLPHVSKATGPWTIDLSNTSLDNGWRLEMQSIVKLAASVAPLNKVHFNIVNAPNTVAGQIESVQSMIAAHVNAIIIDANSPTALNPVMDEAVKAGIPVFSMDSPTTSTEVYHLGTNLVESGYIEGLWLAEAMGGKGNVVMSEGITGTGGADQENEGGYMAFKKFPGIHIVDQYNGQWADAPSEAGMAAILATNSNIQGVWNEGGADGVLQAFLKAHRALVPITGFAFNNFMLDPFLHKGLQMIAGSNPIYMSVTALEDAVAVLEGKKVPKNTAFPITMYEYPKLLPLPKTFTEAGWGPASYLLDVKGTSAVPGLNAEFSFPYEPPGYHFTLKQVEAGM
ncbi:MAG: substrate-binding domain-containing protein [Acidimicrobiales bacterium]|jgi:ribose transport system substrate-binding protein